MTERNPLDVLRKGSIGRTCDWYAAGLSEYQLKSLIRQGLLVRMHHGVYATAAAITSSKRNPAHEHALLVAAARAAIGPDAVASHESAALMHDIQLLRSPQEGTVTVTRPTGGRHGNRLPNGIVVRAAGLPAEHVTRQFKVPVTTPARTVADLARSADLMAAVVAADSALRQSRTTKALIGDVLESCQKWPGLSQARRVVEFSDERSESVLESCARVVFHQHGLPPPVLQAELGAERFAGRVDFYWRDFLTAAEADGEVKYATSARAVAQLERDQALRAAGFRVVHFTWQQLFGEQRLVISRIRQAFRGELA